MARPHYTRVAVAQLDFVPAAVIEWRSPLEDPLFELGATDSLLPDSGILPPALHPALQALRARVRTSYIEQYWLKLAAVVEACRGWEVKVLVLPEYSVPWELLPRLAAAAKEVVVVAGTHSVERAARRAGVYEQLGWAAPVVGGTAVAPVLYGGRLIGLQAKLAPATPEQGSLVPGNEWQPINTDGPDGPGIPGPMGVLICLDFVFREGDGYVGQVGPVIKDTDTRFLAVPSYTPWHSRDEFAATAWQDARRYARPVLFANVASHGGSSLFVDEWQRADLRRFPDRAGYLDRGGRAAWRRLPAVHRPRLGATEPPLGWSDSPHHYAGIRGRAAGGWRPQRLADSPHATAAEITLPRSTSSVSSASVNPRTLPSVLPTDASPSS